MRTMSPRQRDERTAERRLERGRKRGCGREEWRKKRRQEEEQVDDTAEEEKVKIEQRERETVAR